MTVRASTMIIAERGVEKPEKGNLLQWNDFNFWPVGAITTFDVALEAAACADVKTPLIFYLILIWRQDMTVRASTMIIAERGVEKPEKGNLLQWNDFNFWPVGAITTFDVALEAAACADVKTPLIFYLILIWRQDMTVRASTMIIAERGVEKPEKGNLLQWNDFNFWPVGAITTFDVALEAAACADVKTPLIFYLILIWRQDMTVRASTMIIAERGVEKPEKGNLLQWNDFNFWPVGAITTFDVALEAAACADVKTPLIFFYLILIWRQDMTVRASTMIIAERGVEKPEKGNLLQWNDFNFWPVGAITTFDVALEAAACADVKTPLIFFI